jgi:hypothetical protein
MPSTQTDRLGGLTTSVAVKPPCKAVSTTALTLSGEQTVNGVACVDGDRVLYALTGSSVDNGIWVVRDTAWERAKDFDGARDVVKGTLILVAPGTADSAIYAVTTDGDLAPGTTSLTIIPFSGDAATLLNDLANGTLGPSLIGVKRTDAGTVATTLNLWIQRSKLSMRRDYSAVMDGVTNEAAKLTAAFADIAAYGGGELELGLGTLRITSAVTLPENLTFTGEGREVSKIKVDGAVAGLSKLYADHSVTRALNLHMRNLGLFGGATALGGLKLSYADWVTLDHVGFEDFTSATGYGMELVNCYRWHVDHGHFENTKLYGLKLTPDGSGVGCNLGRLSRSELIGNNQASFIAAHIAGQQIEIDGNDFEGSSNGSIAINMDGVEGVHIHGNYIELWLNASGSAIRGSGGARCNRVLIEQNVLNGTGPVINASNANTNDRWTIRHNRFPDIGAGVDLILPGNTTRFIEYSNDPDASDMTAAYTASDSDVTTVNDTFTGTLTGCTTSPTGTIRYNKTGNQVTLYIPAFTGTSNSNACTVTGMPARLYPARVQVVPGRYRDNGVDAMGLISVSLAGVLTLTNQAGSSTSFTNSGEKGTAAVTITYALD